MNHVVRYKGLAAESHSNKIYATETSKSDKNKPNKPRQPQSSLVTKFTT